MELDAEKEQLPENNLLDTDFGVDTGEIVIKQEPTDMITVELMEVDHQLPHGFENDDAIDDELPEDYNEEVSDVILQRAVSPPSYIDPDEEKIEKLMLYYKEKYDLKDVTVALESCDKIWETLQLIKNLQDSSEDLEDEDFQNSPKNISQSQLPGPFIPYRPNLGNNNKALPDFRFSVKSKKKLYHCITCGKEYLDSNHLRQHAINEHGVYVNPKRIYNQRVDSVLKANSSLETNKRRLSEKMEIESTILSAPIINQPVEPVQFPQSVENRENSLNSNLKVEDSQTRVAANGKEKIKCILCKRICTDIVYHMKGYHKVGCISSIIAQCEKIIDNVPVQSTESNMSENMTVETSEEVPEPPEVDLNESLTVAVKKRKRGHPRWSLPKKKFRSSNVSFRVSSKGPYKCNVCLGLYKNPKSFSYHRRLHRIRNETPENFDPTTCRFKNSPLRPSKVAEGSQEILTNFASVQKEPEKHQTAITNYITVKKERAPLIEKVAPIISQDFNADESNSNSETECTSCDCGRSFRNYHTMYLHKVKCKGPYSKSPNDVDSGVGISIKIKKNKNDSYEVVPTNPPTEETFKDNRSCKDSDASSNDSGVVSVDENNQKSDSSELPKYTKTHSILRIQAADDDEEVDIEDADSIDSNLNEDNAISVTNPVNNIIPKLQEVKHLPAQPTVVRSVRSLTRRSNLVPTLSNLCKQVLAKTKEEKEQISSYKCHTCSKYFKNKNELMEHGEKTQHNVKSHCPCGKQFKNLKVFNIHVRRYHPLLLKCSYCKTNFDRIEKYFEHKCEVTEGELFIEPILQTECTECKTLVDIGEPFDKHMKTHITDEVNLYQCYKCELRFENPHQRKAHFTKEHRFFFCKICSMRLHVDYLSKHEAYHDGLGYPCHLCKKAFSQKILFKRHVQNTHDPVVNEVVKCIVCSKSMKLRYLKKHMSFHLHTEICRKCNKCIRNDEQNDLENHIAEDHPDDYPTLKCDTCNTSFLSDKRYEEHCQEGSCKSDVNSISTFVQNATTD